MTKNLMFVMAVLLIAVPAMAMGKTPKSGAESETKQIQKRQPPVEEVFSEAEVNKIRNYYRNIDAAEKSGKTGKKMKPLPAGLQKKLARGGELPPGWQKKVARGEVLDEDVYHLSESLPEDLKNQLSTQPPGTKIIRAQDKIIRVMEATREIVDVMDL
jgi:hypothetical protein